MQSSLRHRDDDDDDDFVLFPLTHELSVAASEDVSRECPSFPDCAADGRYDKFLRTYVITLYVL